MPVAPAAHRVDRDKATAVMRPSATSTQHWPPLTPAPTQGLRVGACRARASRGRTDHLASSASIWHHPVQVVCFDLPSPRRARDRDAGARAARLEAPAVRGTPSLRPAAAPAPAAAEAEPKHDGARRRGGRGTAASHPPRPRALSGLQGVVSSTLGLTYSRRALNLLALLVEEISHSADLTVMFAGSRTRGSRGVPDGERTSGRFDLMVSESGHRWAARRPASRSMTSSRTSCPSPVRELLVLAPHDGEALLNEDALEQEEFLPFSGGAVAERIALARIVTRRPLRRSPRAEARVPASGCPRSPGP